MYFTKKQPTYNPQKTKGHKRKVSSAKSRNKSNERRKEVDKVYNNENCKTDYDSTERYPLNVQEADFETEYFELMNYLENNHNYVYDELCNGDVQLFSTDKQKSKLHPTQKPIKLMEYLVKTYTNEGETVLDFTMGSGTTILSCKNLNRKAIGIELDKKYFDIVVERLK